MSGPASTSSRHAPDIDLPINEKGTKSHMAYEDPAVFAEEGSENMSTTLKDILEVLRGSTIAGESGKGIESKFWATYKKVSNEYDDDFLDRANDDMGIILTFAGLFSAVNSTFIIGMQPNPGDTTNALMVQLIQIIATGNIPDISNLSSSTNYSSSAIWMQTLAYASLAFSVLAAFGAVMGKQWLNSYKAAWKDASSLEDRGLLRQRKLDGLEHWQLQTVLGAFLILLQISLFLFGLSLSARVWIQQPKMSSVIICTTAFGLLFYWGTVLVSMWYPDSPFQSPGTQYIGVVWHKIRAVKSPPTPKDKPSTISWMLKTSTNPDVVEAAAAMIPLVQWEAKHKTSAIYERLLDTFRAHPHRPELLLKCGKAMAYLCSQPKSVYIKPSLLQRHGEGIGEHFGSGSRFIHDAFVAGSLAWHQFMIAKEHDDKHKHGHSAWDQDTMALEDREKQKHKADIRTAVRTMVVHRKRDYLSRADDVDVVWDGDLHWWRHNGQHTLGCEEVDWLVDYLNEKDNGADDQTVCHALLALGAMHGLGSPSKQASYIMALIRFMHPTRPLQVRHAALRAISDAREEVSSITSKSPQGVDTKLLDDLSRDILSVVRQNDNQVLHDTNVINVRRDLRYMRLIFSLVQNDEWRQRLTRDGHIERCMSLVGGPLDYYLVGIFAHFDPSGDLPFGPASVRSRPSMSEAWVHVSELLRKGLIILDEALPAFVTATRQSFLESDNDVTNDEFQVLALRVQVVLKKLRSPKTPLNGQVVDAALLSSMQELYDDLSCMFELTNDSRSDNGFMGSKEKY